MRNDRSIKVRAIALNIVIESNTGDICVYLRCVLRLRVCDLYIYGYSDPSALAKSDWFRIWCPSQA